MLEEISLFALLETKSLTHTKDLAVIFLFGNSLHIRIV